MSSVALALPSEQARTGPVLRLSAAAGAVGTGLVVASAALELGTAHWGIVALTLPFLAANAVLARLSYPRLVARTLAALVLFLVAIALGGVVAWSGSARWAVAVHVGAAAVALGASLVAFAAVLRGASAPLASPRDYLTLTKPRIMTLLLLTGAAGMFVGAPVSSRSVMMRGFVSVR